MSLMPDSSSKPKANENKASMKKICRTSKIQLRWLSEAKAQQEKTRHANREKLLRHGLASQQQDSTIGAGPEFSATRCITHKLFRGVLIQPRHSSWGENTHSSARWDTKMMSSDNSRSPNIIMLESPKLYSWCRIKLLGLSTSKSYES